MVLQAIKFRNRIGLVLTLLIYLTACIVFGGAGREGLFAHGALQAAASLGIGLLIVSWPGSLEIGRARLPLTVLLSVFFLGVLHTVSLPVEIQQFMPNRSFVREGFEEFAVAPDSLPISLDKDASLSTLGYVLTPVFVLLLAIRVGWTLNRTFIPVFLCGIGLISVVFGLFQLVRIGTSDLYLYDFTNRGFPVGFFSNVNHQATLLLMIMPFAAFLTFRLTLLKNSDGRLAFAIALVATWILFLLGVVATGSVAGYVLLTVVLFLIVFAVRPYVRSIHRRWIYLCGAGALAIAIALTLSSPLLERLGQTSFDDGELSRLGIWRMTSEAISDHWLMGTGLGTFESVIPLYEDPDQVTSTFVAKAHNEYLQIAMEGGLPGIAVAILGLWWFFKTAVSIMVDTRTNSDSLLRRCAAISVSVVALHSIVDYPARTPAIAALLGVSIAIMLGPEKRQENTKSIAGLQASKAKFLEL